jgi:hypothetical protein
MYSGPPLPRDQVAIVKTARPVGFCSVDGVDLAGKELFGVELLPGNHVFKVALVHIWPEWPLDGTGRQLTHILKVPHTLEVKLDALQGKEYFFYGLMNKVQTEAFVIVKDTATSELVVQSEKALLYHEIEEVRF